MAGEVPSSGSTALGSQANHNGGKLLIAAFVCNALNW